MVLTYRFIPVLCVALTVCPLSVAQQSPQTNTIVVQKKTLAVAANERTALPAHPATVEQFREYLKLSRVGEIWRAGWMDALEANRSKGEPYWPESFWTDVRDEMQKTDLAPFILEVYRPYISGDMMDAVNAALQKQSLAEFATTSLGSQFCKLWDSGQEAGKRATLNLTLEISERVYEWHKVEIKAARAKYLAEHPAWKD